MKNIIVLVLWFYTILAIALPPHGGEKHHYDKSAVAKDLPVREREVKLNYGTAECVRTAWIGDINNRKLICVEYRYKK
jgi:hypothetical protein